MMRARRALGSMAASLVLLLGFAALDTLADDAPEFAVFVLASEVRPRLVGTNTRFEDSLVRQSVLDAESASTRFRSDAMAACLGDLFRSIEQLCDAKPGVPPRATPAAGDSGPATGAPRTIELPPLVTPPRVPEATREADEPPSALPSPDAPIEAHRCAIASLPVPVREALLPLAAQLGAKRITLALQVTSTIPPSEADKRTYWRYHGRRKRSATDAPSPGEGAGLVQSEDGPRPSATLEGEQVPYEEFLATLPDWEHEPFRLRLQLRAESEGEAPRLLGGMLLGTAARAPVAEGETPEPPPNCALNSTRLRDLAMRQ